MKKLFAVALIFVTIFICGCAGEKPADNPAEPKIEQPEPVEPKKIDAFAADGTIWAIDEENMTYLADALDRNDSEYLKQLSLEEKAFLVDRDTKVVRIGEETPTGFVMIKFKEGRYTNKTGYTRARNIFTEEEYPAYLEAKAARKQSKLEAAQAEKYAERQKLFDMIQSYLAGTENYFDFITSDNVEEVKRIKEFMATEEPQIIAIKKDVRVDADIRECADKAHHIVMDRYATIVYYLNHNVKNRTEYQKAEQLRQAFRDKYGF